MHSWLTRKLRLSISECFHNKAHIYPDNEDMCFTTSFTNQTLTAHELSDKIKNGFAYCAEHRGRRKTENFIASDILSLDVDGDEGNPFPIEVALNHPFVQQYGTIFYTTPSHTPDAHRFRLVFALERTITDPGEMRAAARSLALRLNGDSRVIDAARMFFGNTEADIQVFDRGIPCAVLEELIAQNFNEVPKGKNYQPLQGDIVRSALKIKADHPVLTSTGVLVALSSLKNSQPIHCPFHDDRNPSAYVCRTKNGINGVHCSTCKATFFPLGADEFDFHEFDKELFAVRNYANSHATQAIAFATIPDLNEANVQIVTTKFLPSIEFKPGVTFIKSPKGSGKTEQLANNLPKTGARILLIGHRRALIREQCKRLGIDCYLEKSPKKDGGKWLKRYGVCLDSLKQINVAEPYDYIVVDEIEQVLSHLLSKTINKRRYHALQAFIEVVAKAKHVVALDADISKISFHHLTKWAKKYDQSKQVHVVLNDHKQPDREIEIFESREHLIEDLCLAIKRGETCFVTSNSMAKIHDLAKTLELEGCPPDKILVVTSETIDSPSAQQFIADVGHEARRYQAILASPSLGTGIDISFPEDHPVIQNVYGFFESLILTHHECDQQIARVRKPKNVKVFIASRRFNFETQEDVVRSILLSGELFEHLINGFKPETGQPIYNTEDDLFELAVSVISARRSSLNNLRRHFSDYKRYQGWIVKIIKKDDEQAVNGKIRMENGKEFYLEELTDRLLAAKPISEKECEIVRLAHDRNVPVPVDMWLSYERMKMELFYRQKVSARLIKTDDRGHTRRKVRLFEDVNSRLSIELYKSKLANGFEFGFKQYTAIPDREAKAVFLAHILHLAGLMDSDGIKRDAQIQKTDLKLFVEFLRQYKAQIEGLFNNPLRKGKDLEKNAIPQLKVFLRDIGLTLPKAKTRRRNYVKMYLYKLDVTALDSMQKIVRRRAKYSDPWSTINRRYKLPEFHRMDPDERPKIPANWRLNHRVSPPSDEIEMNPLERFVDDSEGDSDEVIYKNTSLYSVIPLQP